MKWNEDPINRAPDIVGNVPMARAWFADMDAVYAHHNYSREWGSEVATWLVEAPWAHPFWHSYMIHLQHLRPITSGPLVGKEKDIVFHLPGATHELWVKALDPDQPRQEQLDTGLWRPLSPSNFAAQIIASSDAAALERVENAVREICAGQLSPDTDYRSFWVARFGDNMIKA